MVAGSTHVSTSLPSTTMDRTIEINHTTEQPAPTNSIKVPSVAPKPPKGHLAASNTIMHQTINRTMDHSINIMECSSNPTMIHSIDSTIFLTTRQTMDHLASQSVDPLTNHTMDHSLQPKMDHSTNPTQGHSVNYQMHLSVHANMDHLISQPTLDRSRLLPISQLHPPLSWGSCLHLITCHQPPCSIQPRGSSSLLHQATHLDFLMADFQLVKLV